MSGIVKFSSIDFFAQHPVFRVEQYVHARGERSKASRTAQNLLSRHAKTGRLVRVRRGLYASVPPGIRPDEWSVDPYLVASKFAADAVLCHHTALQLRGHAYSIWHRFPVMTASRPTPLRFQGSEWLAVAPPKAVRHLPDFGGGITEVHHAGATLRVTTPERTLVDVMHSPQFGGDWEEIWRSLAMVDFYDLDAVVHHALRMDSAQTAARVGLFLSQHRETLFVQDEHLQALADVAPRQATYLDRGRREPGTLVKPWNLVVPDAVLHQRWEEVA